MSRTTDSPVSVPPMTSPRRSELWQRLRIARSLAGVTQAELAEALHVSRPAVTFWENKDPKFRTSMNAGQVQNVCKFLGVSMGLLMDDTLTQAEFEQLAARERTTHQTGRHEPVRVPNSQAQGLAFFSALRYHVLAANADLVPAFDVELPAGGLGLVASFAVPGHVVQFVVQQSGQVDEGDRLQIVKETGHLLMLERALTFAPARGSPKTVRKHLILYTPTGQYSMQGREEYESAFGVQLFIGGDVGATAKYLIDMV